MDSRLDGATRADRADAAALVAAGAFLLLLPISAFIDRSDGVWLWVALFAGALGGVLLALGLRWFLAEGPALEAKAVAADASGIEAQLPVDLRLVDARLRTRAHGLRGLAYGTALVAVVLDLGRIEWLGIALIFISFLADQVWLRARLVRFDSKGMHPQGLFANSGLEWDHVTTLYWRHYPTDDKPPFPTAERLILEGEPGMDREFSFPGNSDPSDGAHLMQALLPVLGERLRILRPRQQRATTGADADGGSPKR